MTRFNVNDLKMNIYLEYVAPRVKKYELLRQNTSDNDTAMHAIKVIQTINEEWQKLYWYFSHISRRCNSIEQIMGCVPSSMHRWIVIKPGQVADPKHKLEEFYEGLEALPLQKFLEE